MDDLSPWDRIVLALLTWPIAIVLGFVTLVLADWLLPSDRDPRPEHRHRR